MKRSFVALTICAAAAGAAWAQTAPAGSASRPPSLPESLPKTVAPLADKLPKPPGLTQSTVITSDDLQMDMDKKIAVFTGHVKVVDQQGTMTSDKMIVHMAKEGDNENGMQKMEAYGGVVISQEGRKAISDEAIYTSSDKMLVLTGAAQVETSSGIVSGEIIHYDMQKNTAIVKGRPRMKIEKMGSGLFPSVPKAAPATGAGSPATPAAPAAAKSNP